MRAFVVMVVVVLAGCIDGGDDKGAAGIVRADEAPFGPMIRFEPLTTPIPEVPLPNDILLTNDPDSATGLAWNVTTNAPTAMERQIRKLLPNLDGFGSFAPISVSFDGPIDLSTVDAQSFVVVDIDTGERVPLDFGSGLYPIDGGGRFWAYDDNDDLPDFLLPRDNDDADGERIAFYEVETNTLIIRPVFPFRAGARHAVLITSRMRGQASPDGTPGRAVRSPFAYKAHAAQTELVKKAADEVGITTGELAFGWTFTVGRPDSPLHEVREGLYGRGRLKGLDKAFPPSVGEVRDTGIDNDANGVDYPADPQDHRFILQGEFLKSILSVFIGLSSGFSVDFDHVDYVAFGSLQSPDVRTGLGNSFATPSAALPATPVPYLVAIPKTTEQYRPPFPVVFYFHGTGSSRFEFIALANNLAHLGIATVAFDQVGHGPIIPDVRTLLAGQGLDGQVLVSLLANLLVPDRAAEFEGLSFQDGFAKLEEIGFFRELAEIGRTEDATGDGRLESSESFFFADPFTQCGAFQQDLVDFMMFVRLLRSFDQGKVPPALASPASASDAELMAHIEAGDFNADGVLDLGGPAVSIGTAGTSLGGIHSLLAAAVEPEVATATPIASGGGLSDMLLRSGLRQITRVIYLEVFGPLVIGCPDGVGGVWLSLNDESDKCGADPTRTSFAHVDTLTEGDTVTVEDLDNHEVSHKVIGAIPEGGAGFSLSVPADHWDQLRVRITASDGRERAAVLVQTPYQGLALERNTPEFRRFVAITQHALDRCDPIAFASLVADKPVLFENGIGDHTVPISTGLALARAAGIFGFDAHTIDERMAPFIDSGVMDGELYDVDDILGNNGPDQPAFGPIPAREVDDQGHLAAIRFAFAKGRHEWIAGPTEGAEYAAHTLSRNRIALFHWSGGKVVSDDPCIIDDACPKLDNPASFLPAKP